MAVLAFDLLFVTLFVGGVALTLRGAIRAQGWRLLALAILPALPLVYFLMPPLHSPGTPFALPPRDVSTAYEYVSMGLFVGNIAVSGVLYAWLKGARAFAGVIILANVLFSLIALFAVNSGY